MNGPFRALRHRYFAWFVLGQSAGLLGYWIQQIALHWLMYRLTGSALMIGVTVFAAQIPVLVLGPLAGALADRMDLYRSFVVVQALQALQAFAMAGLAFAGVIEPWHMMALALFLGVTIAFELPLRHAFLPDLLSTRDDLPNAVAVTSFVGSAGRLVGPSIAGLVIAGFSEATCFLINGLSFVIVLWTLALMRKAPRRKPATQSRPVLADLAEGARYAWHLRPIRVLLLTLAVVSFMATPYQPLMPAFVRETFQGGPEALGFLIAAAGLGALAGTGYLAARAHTTGLVQLIAWGSGCAGIALVIFTLSRWYPLSLLLMAVTGFGILATTVSISMILQASIDDHMRGRVMSLYTAAFLGVAPLGGFVAGAVADWIGAANTLLIGGFCCALAALLLVRADIRDLSAPQPASGT